MTLLKHHSIRTKLLLLTSASVMLALGLVFVAFVANDFFSVRRSKLKELQGQARILGFNSSAVLAFQDKSAAAQLLQALKTLPHVEEACLYDHRNVVLARYVQEGKSPTMAGKVAPLEGHRYTALAGVEVYHPVMDNKETIGMLVMRADMSDIYAHLLQYALIGCVVTVFALAVSIAFTLVLQQGITRPIRNLADTAKQITSNLDFTIRVENETADETGDLCHSFNSMLDQIETSKADLRQAHAELEERVNRRTAQLSSEVAHRKIIQSDLERAKNEAEKANRAKSRFLANMSHEIRTPLNAILGFTDVLLNGGDEGDEITRSRFLNTIRKSGKHLLGLINDILDLSKIEAETLEVEKTMFSPHDVATEVVNLLRGKAEERGLSLEYRWDTSIPDKVHSDPIRLRQLLTNLIGNAIKFTESGGVTVIGKVTQGYEPTLVFEIHDTGIGIAPDKTEVIFSPFVQADSSVTRKYGGTGLGLAISRKVVEALGGQLTVTSEIDRGSVFTVSIDPGPLRNTQMLTPSAADSTLVLSSGCQGIGSTSTLLGVRVLLVEDGEINQELISFVLQKAGASVRIAEHGKLGVQAVEEEEFDLILMDMQMPVMDGYTATTELRAKGCELPIIALTAHAMKGDKERCLEAGCSDYLTKPVEPSNLVDTVKKSIHVEGAAVSSHSSTANDGLLDTLGSRIGELKLAAKLQNYDELRRLIKWLKVAGDAAGLTEVSHSVATLESRLADPGKTQVADAVNDLATVCARLQSAEATSA